MTLNLIRPGTQTSENPEPLILSLTMMCLDLTLIAKTIKAKMKQTKHPKIRGTMWVLVAQSCPTLCDPIFCTPSDSSVHGILQARTLGWVAIPFSRGSS